MKLKIFRLLSSLTLGAILMLFLNSCSQNNTDYDLDANEPITINIWHYYNGVQQTMFDEMVNEFNETVGYEKGIIVETYASSSVSELSNSVMSSLNSNIGSDELPNIFASYVETAYVADELGYVADMKNYFSNDELSEYVDEYIQEGIFTSDNSLKIFPIAKSTEVMMINLTDWQKFADATNVSTDDLKTWEGLAQVAEKYYNYTDDLTPDVQNDGKAFFGRDSSANYMNIGAEQLGYEYVTLQDGSVSPNFDKTALRRLWDNYYVPYVKGYYTAQSRFRTDDAKIGNIIALIGSTTGATYYPTSVTINDDYTYPIENIVLPIPNFEGCDPYLVQQGAGFVVTKSDEKTEYACSLFLKWFTETDRNIEFSIGSGYLPVKKEANNMDKIIEINNQQGLTEDETLINTIQVALDEISYSQLYTSKPYKNSDKVRDYLQVSIHDNAISTYAEVFNRISNGENRDDVINEYTNDDAFEIWYNEFQSNLTDIVNTK